MEKIDTRSSHENRTTREKFTRALERMCERLDAKSRFEIEDNDRLTREAIEDGYLTAADARETLDITALWVVGSYARGALMLERGDAVADIAIWFGIRAYQVQLIQCGATHFMVRPAPAFRVAAARSIPRHARGYLALERIHAAEAELRRVAARARRSHRSVG